LHKYSKQDAIWLLHISHIQELRRARVPALWSAIAWLFAPPVAHGRRLPGRLFSRHALRYCRWNLPSISLSCCLSAGPIRKQGLVHPVPP
jgi:hypothetical protein